MSALLSLLLSHLKLALVTVAVAGTATVAIVANSDPTNAPDAAVLLAQEAEEADEEAAEIDELLAQFSEECGADAVAPDLTGMSEDEAEATVEPLIDACEEAAEAAEEADEASNPEDADDEHVEDVDEHSEDESEDDDADDADDEDDEEDEDDEDDEDEGEDD